MQPAGSRRTTWAPYFQIAPGTAWMVVFFLVPMLLMLIFSFEQGSIFTGFKQTFHWQNYPHFLSLYHAQLIRSLIYGGLATLAMIVIAYPVAYWIAFHAGARKSAYLFLILLPFFVTFVLRTVAWKFLLSDGGILLGPLKSIGLLPASFHVLATGFAVVAGLTYNFLPFMILPLFVALERVDPALLEAGSDLYGGRIAIFRHIIFPLSVPGLFAGVLLTFVPAASDYINAGILGGTHQVMIGTIIETLYITNSQYPAGAALSFVLLAVLLTGVLVYVRLQGTDTALEAAAA